MKSSLHRQAVVTYVEPSLAETIDAEAYKLGLSRAAFLRLHLIRSLGRHGTEIGSPTPERAA